MFRDKVLDKYEKLNQDEFLVQAEDVINKNPYKDIEQLIDWIANVSIKKIVHKEEIIPFEDCIHSTSGIRELLERGDCYYTNLFRENGYIKDHTLDKENRAVLTEIFQEVYSIISGTPKRFSVSLIVYDKLKAYIGNIFSDKITQNHSFQKYEHWLALEERFVYERFIAFDWIDGIAPHLIELELLKFCTLADKTTLSDLAINLDRRKDNNYEDYIAYFNQIAKLPVLDYLDKAVDVNNSWHFKGEIYFRLHLSKKAGIKYWLQLVDQLRYPFLQDNTFIDINDTSDYGEMIEVLANEQNSFSTPREHLIILTLNNFMEFVQRTSMGFLDYQMGRKQVQSDIELKKIAEEDFIGWQKDNLAPTFNHILQALFPGVELSDSPYLNLFFEWINKYRLDDVLTHKDTALEKALKVLLPIFQQRLIDAPNSPNVVLSNITIKNLNELSMLGNCWYENKELEMRDALFEKYCNYISSSSLIWNVSNTYSNEIVNQAYHFSLLILDYPDYEKKWNLLFEKNKIRYEGWKSNGSPSSEYYQKECYLLLVGIGISCILFEREEANKGDEILSKLIQITLSQYRSQRNDRFDYLIPLKFIVFVKSKYCQPELYVLLDQLTQKIDHLQFVLELWNEALVQAETFYVPNNLSEQLKKRIELEFELLEIEFKYPHQRKKLNYLVEIKNKLLLFTGKRFE